MSRSQWIEWHQLKSSTAPLDVVSNLVSDEAFRVLTAVEMGSESIVPTQLIANIAQLKHDGVHKILWELANNVLVSREKNAKYEGYRLTYGGYDYLALRTLCKRGVIYSVETRSALGKNIYIVADEDGNQRVLKIHRLGRTSFRNIKSKRDYLQNRNTSSWLYLSRLATKNLLPDPVDSNHHCIVMELVKNMGKLYSDLMDIIVRLAGSGLIHGDFNEFNLMVQDETANPTLIDFPQMVSTSHRNAAMYFESDVECIRTFFRRRFNYESHLYPTFSNDATKEFDLDIQVAPSGFTKKHEKEFEQMLDEAGASVRDGDVVGSEDEDGDSSFEEDGDSDEKEGLEKLNNREQRPYRDAPRPFSGGASHSANPAPVKLDAQEIKERVSKALQKGRSSEHTNRKRNSGKASSRRAAMESAKHSAVWG
ncbi:RIO1 family-domain-containing protein [Cladochytrium replicatum]|nr:RIO1 family-domain-containing protein [Cladochytrium replicatum]